MLIDILSAILLGSMAFFAIVIAPCIHKTLEPDQALKVTRALFPRYFMFGIILSGFALIFSLFDFSFSTFLLILVLAGFIYSQQFLTPKILEARNQLDDDDSIENKTHYKKLHQTSVVINVVQMILLVFVLL